MSASSDSSVFGAFGGSVDENGVVTGPDEPVSPGFARPSLNAAAMAALGIKPPPREEAAPAAAPPPSEAAAAPVPEAPASSSATPAKAAAEPTEVMPSARPRPAPGASQRPSATVADGVRSIPAGLHEAKGHARSRDNTEGARPFDRTAVNLKEAAKGLVAHVQFSYRSAGFAISTEVACECPIGSYVLVDGDRGVDAGKLVSVSYGTPPIRASGIRMVRRLANEEEIERVEKMRRRAADALTTVRALQREKAMPPEFKAAEVVACEFQMDGKTLIVHIRTPGYINFEPINAPLFRKYHARVWICQLRDHDRQD